MDDFDYTSMGSDGTEEDFTLALVQRAKKGVHSNFTFIRSWQERNNIINYLEASQEVSKHFKKIGQDILKDYLKTIDDPKPNLELILTAVNCMEIAEFYKKEVDIANDMCKEHLVYMFSGHLLDTFFGNYRLDCDLYDHRNKKVDNNGK